MTGPLILPAPTFFWLAGVPQYCCQRLHPGLQLALRVRRRPVLLLSDASAATTAAAGGAVQTALQ